MIPVAIGIEACASWLAHKKGNRAVLAASIAAMLVASVTSLEGYRDLPFYAQEYRFLVDALLHEGTVVTIWGPVVWYDGPLPRMRPNSFDGLDRSGSEAYLEKVRELSGHGRSWMGCALPTDGFAYGCQP